ncbi:alpha/beta fold hydrolase [Clavibacter michiganensis]|nr:alpha/beta hydrolase [Clavibacter michiganensis]MDO4098554.1 alpha/beta hydrolase [Clavibacter michiganensis]MDO4126425.1 alpha/beta hydrolase [Clavibacter michiganensis]MWJ85495.1 alpha/beta fold hydrolase [Clavibacter michiganensis subsp. michiganensis]NIY59961.1 alpha/beta fold hydrolase [Clavibacter michiganensis subsp. michiganensis]OUE12505.1 Haloacetate dehalogenase H-1 [Clavibacter michiganensis subsp. michiganensis]
MDTATNPLDGTRIAYRTFGARPADARSADGDPRDPARAPVVLVHGTALSQAIWRGFGWVRALSPTRPVITLDLRGHGRSDTPHEPAAYAMDLMVADVVAVLDAIGASVVHHVGYSLGARVGFSLAAAHPDRLVSTSSLGGSPRSGVGVFDRVFFPGCIDALEAGGMPGFLEAWERHSGHPVDSATRGAFLADDARALAAYMRESERDAGVPDAVVAGSPVPLLLVAGTRDPERLRAAHHVKALRPDAPLVELAGATHADTPRHPDALPAVAAFIDAL